MPDTTMPGPRHTSRILGMATEAYRNIPGEPPPVDAEVMARMTKIDQDELIRYRLRRLRAELRRQDFAGGYFVDPMNVRYATGTRNMAVWTLHSPARAAFVATDGPVILFEFTTCRHMTAGSPVVDETRPCTPWFYFAAGSRALEKASLWAAELADLVRAHGGGNRRLAIDKCDPMGSARLQALGLELFDGQAVAEQARVIKSAEEIACLRSAMEVCDLAIGRMRAALRPGITENQLWALLYQTAERLTLWPPPPRPSPQGLLDSHIVV